MATLPLSTWFTGFQLVQYVQYTTSTSNDGNVAIDCACCRMSTEKTFEEVRSWICLHHKNCTGNNTDDNPIINTIANNNSSQNGDNNNNNAIANNNSSQNGDNNAIADDYSDDENTINSGTINENINRLLDTYNTTKFIDIDKAGTIAVNYTQEETNFSFDSVIESALSNNVDFTQHKYKKIEFFKSLYFLRDKHDCSRELVAGILEIVELGRKIPGGRLLSKQIKYTSFVRTCFENKVPKHVPLHMKVEVEWIDGYAYCDPENIFAYYHLNFGKTGTQDWVIWIDDYNTVETMNRRSTYCATVFLEGTVGYGSHCILVLGPGKDRTNIFGRLNRNLRGLIDTGLINISFVGDTPAKCELMNIADSRRSLYTIAAGWIANLKNMKHPGKFPLCQMCHKNALEVVTGTIAESNSRELCPFGECWSANLEQVTWSDRDIWGATVQNVKARKLTKELLTNAIRFVYDHIKVHGKKKRNSQQGNGKNIKHYLQSHGIVKRVVTLIMNDEDNMETVLELFQVFEPSNCFSGLMHMIPLGNETYILDIGKNVDKTRAGSNFQTRLKLLSNEAHNLNLNFLRGKQSPEHLGFKGFNGDEKASLLYYWWLATLNGKLRYLCVVLSALYFAVGSNYSVIKRRNLVKVYITQFEKIFKDENFFFQSRPNLSGLFELCRNVEYNLFSDRVGEGFVKHIKPKSKKAQKRYEKWPVHAVNNFYISEAFRRFGSSTDNSINTYRRSEWSKINEVDIFTATLQSIVQIDRKFYLFGTNSLYEAIITPLAGKVSFFKFEVAAVETENQIEAIFELVNNSENRHCILLKNSEMISSTNNSSVADIGYAIMAKYGDTYNPTTQSFVPLMDAINDYRWEV